MRCARHWDMQQRETEGTVGENYHHHLASLLVPHVRARTSKGAPLSDYTAAKSIGKRVHVLQGRLLPAAYATSRDVKRSRRREEKELSVHTDHFFDPIEVHLHCCNPSTGVLV